MVVPSRCYLICFLLELVKPYVLSLCIFFWVVLNRWLRKYTLIVGVIISDHWRSWDSTCFHDEFLWDYFGVKRRGNHIRNGHVLTWRFDLHRKQAEIGCFSRTSVLVSNLGFLGLALWLIGHSVLSLRLSPLTCTWWSSVSLSLSGVSVRTRSSVSPLLWCSCLAGEISRRLHIHWKVSSLRCCGWAVWLLVWSWVEYIGGSYTWMEVGGRHWS